jgi:catechol 2,3-dioxygenase-like lactoylglutathione lyase family enzyme
MKRYVDGLRYVGLSVPDYETEREFFQGLWGLTEVAQKDGVSYFATQGGEQHHVIRLRQNDDRRMEVVSFSAPDRESVDGLAVHLRERGTKIISEPASLATPGGGYGLRFFDIDGRTVEVSAEVATRNPDIVANRQGVPLTLSHAVFFTPDVAATVAFYEATLGFNVSDWVGDFMCFLRCNTKHHCLAFLTGPASLNHVAFDMRDADDMMRGMGRLLKSNVKLNWGPGRHTAGDNTFAYFMSPGGNVVEYTAELETVDEATWQPTVYPRTFDIIDQWGTSRIGGPVEHGQVQADPGLWTPGAI